MGNNILTERPSTIRALARQTLQGRWVEAFLVLITVQIITDLPVYILESISDSQILSWIGTAYSIIVGAPLSFGVTSYFLKVFRRQPGGMQDLKDSFGLLAKAVNLYVTIYIYTFLWALLFIIPGVIASIRYSQAWFILADDPSKSPRQCIEESKYLMNGNKLLFFKLMLSFAGWIILASVPYGILAYLTDPDFVQLAIEQGPEFWMIYRPSIIVELASLLTLFIDVYINTSQACFYDLLTGNLVMSYEEPKRVFDTEGQNGGF